jgi:hypothetical protein
MTKLNIKVFNPSKPNGNYMYHPAISISNDVFCIYGSRMILSVNSDYFLKQHLTVDRNGVLFEVRNEFLNII